MGVTFHHDTLCDILSFTIAWRNYLVDSRYGTCYHSLEAEDRYEPETDPGDDVQG